MVGRGQGFIYGGDRSSLLLICEVHNLPDCSYHILLFALIGLPESFNVKVKPAGNSPLDVYFLMDFSASMYDDLATVRSISSDIGE